MIILLSNRNQIASHKFGNKLDPNLELRLASVTDYNMEKIPYFTFEEEFSDETRFEFSPTINIHQGDIGDILENLTLNTPQNELNKPWVFFIHGFNQSMDKNLAKCALLEKTHGVNVFAFAWPSRPSVPTDKMSIISSIYSYFKSPSSLLPYKAAISEFIEWKAKVYDEAMTNAHHSLNSLDQSLKFAQNHFFNNIENPVKVTLLVHSLGNYLIENFFKSDKYSISKDSFENVILHQADAHYHSHTDWVNEKSIQCAKNHIIVTHNRKDPVLLASEIEKIAFNDETSDNSSRRLGRGDGTIASTDDKVKYIDFTKSPMVGFDHNFFNLSSIDNSGINSIMSRFLRSHPFDSNYLMDYKSDDQKNFRYIQPSIIEENEYF